MNLLNDYQVKTLPSLGLLGFRLVMGIAFVFHGMGKVPNATNWMGDALPPFIQAAAAYSELLGGAAIALGLLTPLASLSLIGVMVGAMQHHLSAGDPFVAGGPGQGSYELALGYLAGSILFLLNGPGRFSVDYLLLKGFKPGRENADRPTLQT